MSKTKVNRKRKHDHKNLEGLEVVDIPKAKFRPFDEKAEAEEEHLSHILFGGATSFLQCLEEAEHEAGPSSQSNIDSGVGDSDDDNNDEKIKPAWTDEDDVGIDVGQALDSQRRKLPSGGINSRNNTYSNLLRQKFQFGTPQWASLNKRKRTESDSDEEILRSCGFISKTIKDQLPPSVLEFKKVNDLNSETYSEGPYINSVEFHPSSSVALVAGNGTIATLFAVDGKRNNKLHSIKFENYPIVCAKFLQNGNEALLGSRHSYIFSYDLLAAKPIRYTLPQGLTQFKNFVVSPDSQYVAAAGKWGEVHLLSAASKERIATLKQDYTVTALTYNPRGNLLFAHSNTGEITCWDVNMQRLVHKFTDVGCLEGTTISISPNDQFLATGSAEGVVNMYNIEDVLKNAPKPQKSIMNLRHSIKNLNFNSSSEILAFSSAEIQNSIKLFHLETKTVFGNFPNFDPKMGCINSFNFSPGSGFIAFGNKKSVVSLYRLKHYKNY